MVGLVALGACANSTPTEDDLVAELMNSGYDSVSASCFVIELRNVVGLDRAHHLDELSTEELALVKAAADRCLYEPQAARRSSGGGSPTTEPAPIGRSEGVRVLVELGGYPQPLAECMVDVMLATGTGDLTSVLGSDADAVQLRAEAAGECESKR